MPDVRLLVEASTNYPAGRASVPGDILQLQQAEPQIPAPHHGEQCRPGGPTGRISQLHLHHQALRHRGICQPENGNALRTSAEEHLPQHLRFHHGARRHTVRINRNHNRHPVAGQCAGHRPGVYAGHADGILLAGRIRHIAHRFTDFFQPDHTRRTDCRRPPFPNHGPGTRTERGAEDRTDRGDGRRHQL